MANGLFSSGILVNGDRAPEGVCKSSSDCESVGLVATSEELPAFLFSFCRSISCWPLSRVKARTASKRCLYFSIE